MYAEYGRPSPNSDRSLESLEARLRALPRPPVPGDLETRLLSAIPVELPRWEQVSYSRRRRWIVWAGLAGALAAACLLIVLSWPRSDGSKIEVVKHDRGTPGNPDPPPVREVRQDFGPGLGTFTWPLEEDSPMLASTAIPPDLLD
ncbi:MAG TPA: hypothetical protein VGX70_00260 [Gemmataceae bacterium]|jgi:hypothetical protein|nr:hypothetical protein [Gemmataceae bacterium]